MTPPLGKQFRLKERKDIALDLHRTATHGGWEPKENGDGNRQEGS